VGKARITWDATKAASNARDHKVTFEEAATVLDDKLTRYQGDNAKGEDRLIATGDVGLLSHPDRRDPGEGWPRLPHHQRTSRDEARKASI
jgi:Ribonuclease toxin, BrnT, of type II toxin-antitoxin system